MIENIDIDVTLDDGKSVVIESVKVEVTKDDDFELRLSLSKDKTTGIYKIKVIE